jgi:transcriptional regulator of heat shock response
MLFGMNDRQSRLLAAIIDQFIHTALPVGSKKLLECGNFAVSSATIRTEMGVLEDEGYLEQPHISAGRIPTARGYRAFVKEFMEPTAAERKVRQKFEGLREQYFQRKDQEYAYEAVALLANMIPNVAFATVPHKPGVYFMGLANALRQPDFQLNPLLASGVVEILEKRLTGLLGRVEVDERVRYYIGEEHLLPQLLSCSLMVTAYSLRGNGGVVGILGPLRMDYAYNTVALELVADMLRRAA